MHRREFLGGLAFSGAAAQAGLALAYPNTDPMAPFLAKSSLKDNPVAAEFSTPPSPMRLGPITVLNGAKQERLRLPPGITMVSLWAPWCAPCLIELADLAPLQKTYGGAAFNILPLLTNSMSQDTSAKAAQVLAKNSAAVFRPLVVKDVDTSPLSKASERQTGSGSGSSLPCNLLVAHDGRVLARSFGAPPKNKPKPGAVPLTKEQILAKGMKMAEGPGYTIWSADAGRQFVAAFASGEFAKL